MEMDTWRLSRIQNELDQLQVNSDLPPPGFEPVTSNDVEADLEEKLTQGAAGGSNPDFYPIEDGFSDPESLPPYPEIAEDHFLFEDNEDFPTPVPAQIGIVRPLPGVIRTQVTSQSEEIYSIAVVKPKQVTELQAVQAITEKYDSLQKLTAAAAHQGLLRSKEKSVNEKAPERASKLVPSRIAPPPPPPLASPAQNKIVHHAANTFAQVDRPTSEIGLSYSEIIEIRSPARAMSISMGQRSPLLYRAGLGISREELDAWDTIKSNIGKWSYSNENVLTEPAQNLDTPKLDFEPPVLPQTDIQDKRTRETSWTDMDTKSTLSKGVLPVDLTGYPSSSIMKTSVKSSLTAHEILQVEIFYRSRKSEVFVSQCMVDLYYGSVNDTTPENASNSYASGSNAYASGSNLLSNWKLIKPGIPVLVVDSSDRKRGKCVYFIIAERGTGFALWKEQINQHSNYTAKEAMFHTINLSSDKTKLAGLKFHDTCGASDFLQKVSTILSDPDLEDNGKASRKKKQKEKKDKKAKRPDKAAISAPCCSTHITTLDRNEGHGVLEIARTATQPD